MFKGPATPEIHMLHAATATASAAPAAVNAGNATAALRRTMVERQLRPFDVTDLAVLNRFLDVPREFFIPAEFESVAYSDLALPGKGCGRAQLPPLVLARFLQAAEIRPDYRVLDVAGAAGYPAALLSGLAREVVALESEAELAAEARENLAKIGAANVRVVLGPLEKGAPDAAPFDVILIYGAVEARLDALLEQLTPDGRLLAFKRLEPAGGLKAVSFERSDGKFGGARSLFDASAPLLQAFAQPPQFVF